MRSSPRARLAFLAGQGPIKNATVVGGSIAEQTRVTLQDLAGILDHLGADSSAVVSCTCYLADPADVARTAADGFLLDQLDLYPGVTVAPRPG
jgi:enamine deaminase RidA (YjgF/YER057c/UK114 family)